MAAKRKGPSMRESQARKLMMQQIAKGGPQKSGVKKPAPPAKSPQKALPAAGQSGGSKPPKGTTTPQRGGPTRTPAQLAQERRSAAASRKAGAAVGTRASNTAPTRAKGTQTNLRGALNRGAAPTAIAGALLNTPAEIKKLQALLKDPGGTIRRASNEFLSGNAAKSILGKQKNYTQGSTKAGPQPPKRNPPKPSAASTTTRTSSRPSSAPASTRTPSRSSAPSRATAPARPAASASRPASRPAASSAPKPPAASSAPKPPKMPAAQSSFGPVKSGEEYGRMISAPKPPSSSSSPTPKKKSSALTQAQIRKRRLGL